MASIPPCREIGTRALRFPSRLQCKLESEALQKRFGCRRVILCSEKEDSSLAEETKNQLHCSENRHLAGWNGASRRNGGKQRREERWRCTTVLCGDPPPRERKRGLRVQSEVSDDRAESLGIKRGCNEPLLPGSFPRTACTSRRLAPCSLSKGIAAVCRPGVEQVWATMRLRDQARSLKLNSRQHSPLTICKTPRNRANVPFRTLPEGLSAYELCPKPLHSSARRLKPK
jgi:hypothetical protein